MKHIRNKSSTSGGNTTNQEEILHIRRKYYTSGGNTTHQE